jgi:putative hydrolase of HD superfamily
MQPFQQSDESLSNVIDFIAYIDQLKNVIRMNGLYDGSRKENTAEHSWHAALSAVILSGYADEAVDVNRVGIMLLVHDLIEIEAGDVFIYDPEAIAGQAQAELEAAEIVFNKLPPHLRDKLKSLWEEFEARVTPESRFAKAIDRFVPIYSNICNGGYSWRDYGISVAQVQKNIAIIREGSVQLADLTEQMVLDAVNEGWLTTE